jgi:hypothetical protein
MTTQSIVALCAAWLSVGGLALQTARAPGLVEVALSDETRAAARLALRRGTLIALGISALALASEFLVAPVLPGVAQGLSGFAMFGACPLVVFWGGAPLRRRDAAQAASPAAPARRVASLTAREPDQILPRRLWLGPALLLDLPLVAAFLVRDGLTTATWTIVAVSTVFGATFLLTWGAWARLSTTTPQDLSGAADPEALDRACRAFRVFLARGVFALMTLAVAAATAVSFAAIATDGSPSQSAVLGVGGGVVGSLIGVGGAVLGALADRHRRAILELGGLPPEPGVRRPASGETEPSRARAS